MTPDDTARRLAEIRQDSIERRPLAQSDVPFLLDLVGKRDARIAKLEAALREIADLGQGDARQWAEEALKP